MRVSGTFEGTITGGGGGGGDWSGVARLLILGILILGGGAMVAGPVSRAADAVGAWLHWAAVVVGWVIAAGGGLGVCIVIAYWGITKIRDGRKVAKYRADMLARSPQGQIAAQRRREIASRCAPIPMPAKIEDNNRVVATRLDR